MHRRRRVSTKVRQISIPFSQMLLDENGGNF